jgi:chromosome partitioning protein
MKTVAIASQKGGTGKTTTAVHLATAATLRGFDAVVIDLDPQGPAATWGDDRGDNAPEVISGLSLGERVARGEGARRQDRQHN